jgi:hypothetical protein
MLMILLMNSDVDEYFNAIGARLGHYEISYEYNYPDSIDVEFIPSLNPALWTTGQPQDLSPQPTREDSTGLKYSGTWAPKTLKKRATGHSPFLLSSISTTFSNDLWRLPD